MDRVDPLASYQGPPPEMLRPEWLTKRHARGVSPGSAPTPVDALFEAGLALIATALRRPYRSNEDLASEGEELVALWPISVEPVSTHHPGRRDLWGPTATGTDAVPAGTRVIAFDGICSSKSLYQCYRSSEGPFAGVELFAYNSTPRWAFVRPDEPILGDREGAARLLERLRALEAGWTPAELSIMGWRGGDPIPFSWDWDGVLRSVGDRVGTDGDL
jgi:hypothetical protein